MFEKMFVFCFSLLFEALRLLASGEFLRYNQDGGHGGRNASVTNEKIRNTRFGTNRGRLPYFFVQSSRRRSLAGVTARRNFVAKNQRTRKPQVNKKKEYPCSRTGFLDSKEIVLSYMAVRMVAALNVPAVCFGFMSYILPEADAASDCLRNCFRRGSSS